MTVLYRYLPIALIFILWEIASRTGLVAADVLPAFSDVMKSLWFLINEGELGEHVMASLWRTFLGLGLSVVIGLGLGMLLASSPLAERLLQPFLTFLYPLPKTALIPVIIIWLGFGHSAQVAIIFLGCLLPIILGAYNGAKGVEKTLVWSARSLGASPLVTKWHVVARAAFPDMLAGIRVALALSFVLLVSAEMIGGRRGVGYLISFMGEAGEYGGMFAVAFLITAFGFAADRLYLALTRYLLRYREA